VVLPPLASGVYPVKVQWFDVPGMKAETVHRLVVAADGTLSFDWSFPREPGHVNDHVSLAAPIRRRPRQPEWASKEALIVRQQYQVRKIIPDLAKEREVYRTNLLVSVASRASGHPETCVFAFGGRDNGAV
jgi:hypothetical protein